MKKLKLNILGIKVKEIEKYVGYYLLVYISTLSLCGFFQYITICQGKSLECTFSMTGINTIITTTAYVVTPIVAIIGFINWKEQYNIKLEKDDLKIFKNNLLKLKETINYFESHFNDIFEGMNEEINIEDFDDFLSNYSKDIKEINIKRRDLSHISVSYFSTMDIYTSLNQEYDSNNQYEKINNYSLSLDSLINNFSDNKSTLFKENFPDYHKKNNELQASLKILLEDTNRRLKIE